jgi:hypothetical protein
MLPKKPITRLEDEDEDEESMVSVSATPLVPVKVMP